MGKSMRRMKGKVMVAMRWSMLALMTGIGEEDSNMDRANFGIRIMYYSMKESGNVERLMAMAKYTISGES